MRKKTIIMVALFFTMICLVLNPICVGETVWGDLDSRLNTESIEHKGVIYRPKKRLITVLVMGIDQWEEDISSDSTYRNGGQADFQALVVFDESAETVSVIHINRDMMAEMTVINLLGEPIGTRTAQICMAFGYGDGGQVSCKLAVESLSKRFTGIRIDHYLVMRLDGISELNDALGGIEVTLEEDFSVYDPEMTKGTTLKLTGMQAEYYLRNRYYIGDGSNAARLLRQRNYMEAAKVVLMEQSSSNIASLFDVIDPYTVTDMNRGKIMNLANMARRYSIFPVIEIEGENIVGTNGLYEFYPDEEALMRVVLDTFYIA